MPQHNFDFNAIESYQSDFETMVDNMCTSLSAEKASNQQRITEIDSSISSLETAYSDAVSAEQEGKPTSPSSSQISTEIKNLKSEKSNLEQRNKDIDDAIEELNKGKTASQEFLKSIKARMEATDENYKSAVKELIAAINSYTNKINSIADNVEKYLGKDTANFWGYKDEISEFRSNPKSVSTLAAKEVFAKYLDIFNLLYDDENINLMTNQLLNIETKGIKELDLTLFSDSYFKNLLGNETVLKAGLITAMYEKYIYNNFKGDMDQYFNGGSIDALSDAFKNGNINIKELIRNMADDQASMIDSSSLNSIFDFYDTVNTGAPFDLKSRPITDNPYIITSFTDGKSIWAREWESGMTPDYLGNYLFGYYGMSNKNLSENILKAGAGGAQLLSDYKNSLIITSSLPLLKYLLSWSTGNWGDNWGDAKMIQDGIDDYYRSIGLDPNFTPPDGYVENKGGPVSISEKYK